MRTLSRFEELRRRAASSAQAGSVTVVEESLDCESVVLSADDSVRLHPHRLEQEIHSRLMAEPNLNFTSLVVRRVHDGLCLEGVLEVDDSENIGELVRDICGAMPVLNHLVVHRTRELPRKG